jgi:membrane-associated phospholipid phosphatase
MNESALPAANTLKQPWPEPAGPAPAEPGSEFEVEAPLSWNRFFWRAFAVVLNIGLLMILFQAYKLVRKTYIQRGERVGYDHAVQIIDLEKRLHLFFEPDLQQWVIARPDWVIRTFNYYYSYFNPALYVCCAAALLFGPVRFRFWRRVLISSMVLALPWYALYPLAPPRFMTEYGLLDTLSIWGPQYFKEGGLVTANRFAAMPSMHIGWSTIGALMLATCLPRPLGINVGAFIGAFHVVMMTVTIMVTGNHYWLDAVGGWIVIFAAWLAAKYVVDSLPLRLPRWFNPT